MLSEIEIVSEEEKNQVLIEFNQTTTAYPKDQTLHELFAEQAVKTPDTIAVVGTEDENAITYRQLNTKSNQLSALLKQKGVRADSIVGIMADRSL
jgi:non-ribosomal peptide synthetase component F